MKEKKKKLSAPGRNQDPSLEPGDLPRAGRGEREDGLPAAAARDARVRIWKCSSAAIGQK